MTVQDTFDKHASQYDADRRKLIPCFDDFYGVALDIIPFGPERELRVLDLGAGTGLFAEMIARRYPRAHLTLADVSGEMLRLAEARFAKEDRGCIICRQMDYGRDEIGGTFDLVVSALSIHHLEHEAKQALFQRIYRIIEPGGLFVNADQVLGENEVADKMFRQAWLRQVQDRGADRKVLQAALERMRQDRMSPLSWQLEWLRMAGFVEVSSWYQYYSFVVYSGARPLAEHL